MISFFSTETFSRRMRQILSYYISYCMLLMFSQLAVVSLVAFFHFLLDHDMAVVENWLNYNAWEILGLSKFIAFFFIVKAVQLNNYNIKRLRETIYQKRFLPNLETIVFSVFMNIMAIALIDNLSGGFKIFNERNYSLVFVSYFGNILFYLIDFLMIFYLVETFKIDKKKTKIITYSAFTFMFLITTNILQPYAKPNQLFIILYFVTLILVYVKNTRCIGNIFFISFFQIGLFVISLGHDLVWIKNHALVDLNGKLPTLGLTMSWIMGIIYLLRKRNLVD